MQYDELTATQRSGMEDDFLKEWRGEGRAVPSSLAEEGVTRWEALMVDAIRHGDDTTLELELLAPGLMKRTDARGRTMNVPTRARQLAQSEFNTVYVYTLTGRMLREGGGLVEVYRAGDAEVGGHCSVLEGRVFDAALVHQGHRRYREDDVLRVPAHPGCHHSVRRAVTNPGA